MVGRGASTKIVDVDGKIPLQLAGEKGLVDVVRLLRQR